MCTTAHQSNFSIHQFPSHSGPLYLCYTSPYTLFYNLSWVTHHPFAHAVLAWNVHFYSSLPARFLTRYSTTLLDVRKCVPLSWLSKGGATGSKRLVAWVNSSLPCPDVWMAAHDRGQRTALRQVPIEPHWEHRLWILLIPPAPSPSWTCWHSASLGLKWSFPFLECRKISCLLVWMFSANVVWPQLWVVLSCCIYSLCF